MKLKLKEFLGIALVLILGLTLSLLCVRIIEMDLVMMLTILKTSLAVALLMASVVYLLVRLFPKKGAKPIGKDMGWIISLVMAVMALMQIIALTAASPVEGIAVALAAIAVINEVWGLSDLVRNKKGRIPE